MKTALLVFVSWVAAQAAIAQDRPPEAPATSRMSPGAAESTAALDNTRPPQKPATKAQPADSGTPADPPAAIRTAMIGPPPPPRWWLLRDTDADLAACKLALSLLGTVYSEEPAITDPANPDCGIARPLRVTAILPDMALDQGAVMRCDTARALSFWARDFLRPAAATLPGSPRPVGLTLGTTYDCRARVGTGEDAPKLSEHGLGNAVDIAAVRLDDGRALTIAPRTGTGDRDEAFQRAVRGAACLFFTTVLGPGANAAHSDHLHLDVAERRGGWRLCQ